MQAVWRSFNKAVIRRSFLLLASQCPHLTYHKQTIVSSCPTLLLNIQEFLKTPIPYTQNRYLRRKILHVRHNKKEFYVEIDGFRAVLKYSIRDGVMIFHHTSVPKELGGRGLGKSLAKVALDYALRHGLFLVIKCQFVQHYIEKYEPQYAKYMIH